MKSQNIDNMNLTEKQIELKGLIDKELDECIQINNQNIIRLGRVGKMNKRILELNQEIKDLL